MTCKAVELDSNGYSVEDKRIECTLVEDGKYYYLHRETKEVVSADEIFFKADYKSNHLAYIGTKEMYEKFTKEIGITKFDLSHYSHNTVSIGFSEENQKWYGWSHRAVHGFEIGFIVTENATTINDRIDVGYEVKTLNGAKHLAEIFAESVS